MNKKAQLDMDVLSEPAFWILAGFSVSATLLGYIMSKKMEWVPLPIWQLLIILIVEVVASYIITWRMSG